MHQQWQVEVENRLKNRRHKRIWQKVVRTLACIVVFCTTYALILPAITMERAVFCGLEEHEHSEACRKQGYSWLCKEELENLHEHTAVCFDEEGVPCCGYADFLLHTHGSECWDEEGKLICFLPEICEHVHSEECYTVLRGEQICLLEEAVGHSHGEACYPEPELICSLEESEGHAHTDLCLDEDEVLTCGLEETEGHSHADGCFAVSDVLICEEEETEGHTHTDECFVCETKLTCPLREAEEHAHADECRDENGALICGRVEAHRHTHDETCLQAVQDLICGMEESEEHIHGELCYGGQSIACGMQEHTHTLVCYADPAADVESAAVWERTIASVEFSGNAAEDLLAVAESQLGYKESKKNYIVLDDGETTRGYTRYGDWYGDAYGEWCAMFVSFCLHYAGVEDFPLSASCSSWTAELMERGRYCMAEDYVPVPGDLVFFDTDGDRMADHVGIVAEWLTDGGAAQLHTIEGNREDAVRQKSYSADDPAIHGYGVLLEEAEEQPEMESVPFAPEYYYEDESISLTVRVDGKLYRPVEEQNDSAAEENEPGGLFKALSGFEPLLAASQNPDEDTAVQMTVKPVSAGDDSYEAIMDYIEQEEMESDLISLTAMKLEFTYQDELLDMSECTVTAEIVPKQSMIAAADAAMLTLSREAAPEVETGYEISLLQSSETEVVPLDTVYMESSEVAEATVLTSVLNDQNTIAVMSATAANPKFKVQYYAYLDHIKMNSTGDTSTAIEVINTDNGGNGTGGNLPTNGGVNRLVYLPLKNNQPQKESVLTETYASHDYEYIMAPNLSYFNRLYENGNYELIEAWILKAGKSEDSIDPGDWDVYTNPENIHFTNREQSAVDGRILITNDTVIRLVYRTDAGSFANGATFYDYDTTNGRIYASASNAQNETNPLAGASAGGTYYVKTDSNSGNDQQGINDESNYSGSGAKLAFGNSNTRVYLERQSWNGQTLNAYNANNKTYGGGSTFGLVSGLVDGKIRYSSGVIAPKLFNEGDALGKTQIDGYQLVFDRTGDSYTLSKVLNNQGTAVTGSLHQFIGRPNWSGTRTNWANDFWPMDGIYAYSNNYVPGHDMKTGGTETTTIASGAQHPTEGTFTEGFPKSDNGIAHNNYFGMQYSVQFTLTEDYVGPLEYLFFGDDDMWVFLDGRLVCDIGGVHGSVGEYVNLWDWIPKGDSGTHTLSFFYTERGASGSCCYMHFTLPSVSSVVPERNTGNLRVEKTVVSGFSDDEEFSFDIKFTDPAGNHLLDDYAYTRYDKDGNILMHDVIIADGGTFNLRADEYVVIKYLPIGTVYTITENLSTDSGYIVSITATGGTSSGSSVTGTVIEGTIGAAANTVNYVNTFYYELPETGGSGTLWYTICGACMAAAAVMLMCARRRRREGRAE